MHEYSPSMLRWWHVSQHTSRGVDVAEGAVDARDGGIGASMEGGGNVADVEGSVSDGGSDGG
jgi:hypothetical protein